MLRTNSASLAIALTQLSTGDTIASTPRIDRRGGGLFQS